jgi:hypothetical protein
MYVAPNGALKLFWPASSYKHRAPTKLDSHDNPPKLMYNGKQIPVLVIAYARLTYN